MSEQTRDERPKDVEALWREHRRWIAAVLLAHRPEGSDLDDLLQEVAVTLLEKVSEVRDPSRIRPWLRAVAINTARMAGRRARSRKCVRALRDEDEHIEDCDARISSRRVEDRSDLAKVMDLARGLPPEYREPLILRSLEGMSQDEIARILNVPVTTVETRLARARRLLRESLCRRDAEKERDRLTKDLR